MKDSKKNKEFRSGKKFFEGIKFWQKKISEIKSLKSSLKRNKAELHKFPQKLQDQVEIRTETERLINKQLHHEIEQRKKSERVVSDALEYSRGIVDTVREPLLVLDSNLRVIFASRSFYEVFKVKPDTTEGNLVYALGNGQWNIPKLRQLLEDILPKTTSFDNFEVEHVFPQIGKCVMLLNARQVQQKANNSKLILLAIEDITARKQLEERLRTLATHDELTGCLNFRSVTEFLEKEIARCKRYQKRFSIIMVDIDDFKKINDECGHVIGNDALVVFANALRKNVRTIDVVGRYGGEEFIVVLPESDPQNAVGILERVRSCLEKTKISSPQLPKDKAFVLKFSAGIAAFPFNASDLRELLWNVDSALLQAKREGKDRTVLERRKGVRYNPVSGIRVEMANLSDEKNLKILKVENISRDGMSLISSLDIPKKRNLCRIFFCQGIPTFELTCEIKHEIKLDSGLYRIGVYFPGTPEQIQEKLSKCMEFPKQAP